MEEISIKDKFGVQINKIWANKEYSHFPIIKRGFCIPEKLSSNSILFLGINPSFAENELHCNVENYYSLSQFGNYRYFKKFEDIGKECNCTWTHLDLVFFRETNQRYIDTLINLPNGINFICEQLNISKEIIELSNPKIIVVANTKARQFLGKEKSNGKNEWLNYEFEFDHILGTDKIVNQNSKLNGTPVFFTSMLTGQRAIDNGSFERLLWHIKKVLGTMKVNLP